MKKNLILIVSLLFINNIINAMPTKIPDPNNWLKISSLFNAVQIQTKAEILEAEQDAISGVLMADWLQDWDNFRDQD